jgi:hypothetical protein
MPTEGVAALAALAPFREAFRESSRTQGREDLLDAGSVWASHATA